MSRDIQANKRNGMWVNCEKQKQTEEQLSLIRVQKTQIHAIKTFYALYAVGNSLTLCI